MNIPFPHTLKITTIEKAITANIRFVFALFTADAASDKPIQIIIGPVTTGGKNLITFLTPTNLITNASKI